MLIYGGATEIENGVSLKLSTVNVYGLDLRVQLALLLTMSSSFVGFPVDCIVQGLSDRGS